MKLIKKDSNRFRLVDAHYELEGELSFIKAHMIQDMGIDAEEIDFALHTMKALGHDAADFGVNNMFTITQNTAQVNKVLAELNAIQTVKDEMTKAYMQDKDSGDFKYAQSRLLTLVLTLDTKSVLNLLSNHGNRVA